jgi:carboxypeptidase C (cathepsin A)
MVDFLLPGQKETTMSEADKSTPYETPPTAVTAHTIRLNGEATPYRAESGWLTLFKHEKPSAEMFHVFYETEDPNSRHRPVTFVFNGGPGAASAYLHVGALGPRRVVFDDTGNPPPPPVTLVENTDTWLGFTDLVFIDPIGTGFSRAIVDEGSGDSKEKEKNEDPLKEKSKEYWKITRDLDSLGEFITSFLSKHHRWDSPVFIAGESYGGFRGAKLARLLQETYGVGLNGVVLISPALEFALLDQSDYDVLPWIDRIPSMAGAAQFHNRATAPGSDGDSEDFMKSAAEFATGELATMLIRGTGQSEAARHKTLEKLGSFIGLAPEELDKSTGRVTSALFARKLLRDSAEICGLYDATITVSDPFPGRDSYEGPDPTLRSIERVFAAGINSHLRHSLEVDTERRYHLLSMEVNLGWQVDIERHALESQIGSTDDLRYGMALNPHMKVRITHGLYDLVTPYYSTERIAAHLNLKDNVARNLSLVNYAGGHMFYAWEQSRQQFTADIAEFYRGALSRLR